MCQGVADLRTSRAGLDEPQDQSQIAVGLLGCSKRQQDGTELHIST